MENNLPPPASASLSEERPASLPPKKTGRTALFLIIFLSFLGLVTALMGVKIVQETRKRAAVPSSVCANEGVAPGNERHDGKVWIKNGEKVTIKFYYSDTPVSCPYGPNNVPGLEPAVVWKDIVVPEKAFAEVAGGGVYRLRPGKCGQIDVFWPGKPGTQCGDCNPQAGCECVCFKTRLYRNPDCTGEITDLANLHPGERVFLGIKGKKGEDSSLIEKARFRVWVNGAVYSDWEEITVKNERNMFCTPWTVPAVFGHYKIEGEVFNQFCQWK